MLEALAAYYYSLRYQSPAQVAARIRYWLSWRLFPRFPALVRAWCERAVRGCSPSPDFSWRPAAIAHPGYLGGNRFSFLNETVDFGEHIDWNARSRSLLWRFHLHYFDWASTCDPDLLSQQIESWIDANPPGSWPAWHPYPTSLRIVNWIRARATSPRAVDSLALQAAFLERNLEFHLGGNHLLENARALLAASFYLDGLSTIRWRNRTLDLLRRELDKQVLPDGGHIERSPYYHARMTRLVVDTVELLSAHGCQVPPELTQAAERMAAYDRALRHPDGALPLFHDGLSSEQEEPAPLSDGLASFPESGYYILEGPQGRLIADYGAPGACDNPGHQHASIFSFEISAGPLRVVVDTGTPTYERGAERDRLRSTAAHNTVRVDGQDQFQVWGGFRVGRRAWVGPVEEQRGEDYFSIAAAHNGYRRLGVEHRRSIVCVPGAGWMIVDDLSGRGSYPVESFVHFGPAIQPNILEGRVCLRPPGWTVVPFNTCTAPELIPDTYSPAAGVTIPSQTLILRAVSPCRFGYFLGPLTASRVTCENSRLRIESPNQPVISIRL